MKLIIATVIGIGILWSGSAIAQNAPREPTTAYGKCIKAHGGRYDYTKKVWVPTSSANATAARDCAAKAGKR